MSRISEDAVRIVRRAGKGVAAALLHHSGARALLAGVQRRAVGGRRVLILSYHRVVGNFEQEARLGLPTLNISRETFKQQLQTLLRTHDVVTLDTALEVIAGRQKPARDVAVITFDDGYRDIYFHALPVLQELKLPGIVYVPSSFVASERRLCHDRLWPALLKMEERRLSPMAVGVGGTFEAWLRAAFAGEASAHKALERLISAHPTRALEGLADALEDRLDLPRRAPSEGQLGMTWEQLRALSEGGIEIGAHTVDHTVLTNVPLAEARREVARCKAELEAGLRKPVRHFAYCNGWYSAGLAQALREVGYVSGVTTEDIPNLPGTDPFALKRKVLWERSSAGITGAFSPSLAACQLDDVFGILSVQRPVMGARPTFFGESSATESRPAPARLDAERAHG